MRVHLHQVLDNVEDGGVFDVAGGDTAAMVTLL